MPRKKTEYKYYPMLMCGAFFPTEALDILRETVDENIKDNLELFKILFSNADFSSQPAYAKELHVIHNSSTISYEEQEDGYYVGVPYHQIPEHVSPKRASIDIRNVFLISGIIDEDIDPDFVSMIATVVKVKE